MSDRQLLLVIEWEQQKEDRCARDYRAAQQNHQLHRQKLLGLDNYKREYLQLLKNKGNSGLGSLSYSQHQTFIEQLDKASEQQRHVVFQAKQAAEQRKLQWLAQQKKRKAVEMLLDKKRDARQRQEQKREQALNDEVALQRFIRANSRF